MVRQDDVGNRNSVRGNNVAEKEVGVLQLEVNQLKELDAGEQECEDGAGDRQAQANRYPPPFPAHVITLGSYYFAHISANVYFGSLSLFPFLAYAQTTQGLISGRLVDSRTGQPITGAALEYRAASTDAAVTCPQRQGRILLTSAALARPLLRPRRSHRLSGPGVAGTRIAVAARLEVDFRLRPLSDVWESGQYRSVFLPGTQTIVTFYGPDVDTSRSGTFEGAAGQTRDAGIGGLGGDRSGPKSSKFRSQGRDVYTMLVAFPASRPIPEPRAAWAFRQWTAAIGIQLPARRHGE